MSDRMASARMDATVVRALAGSAFRRADTRRDERAAEGGHAVEQFLRSLAGWLPPRREPKARIAVFGRAVAAAADALRDQPDAVVAGRFAGARGTFRRAGLRDAACLAAAFGCIGEASRRRLGLWPHAVQFAGARVLLGGQLAEM